MADAPTIRVDDLSGEPIQELLRLHAAGMEAASPPGACHYFDLGALRRSDVTVWSAWFGDDIAGCGALLELAPDHGEIKSMRTAPAHLGRGVGRAVLDHVMSEARRRSYDRLSLETGRTSEFAAAIALYESAGFEACGPFGEYEESDFSRYFTRSL